MKNETTSYKPVSLVQKLTDKWHPNSSIIITNINHITENRSLIKEDSGENIINAFNMVHKINFLKKFENNREIPVCPFTKAIEENNWYSYLNQWIEWIPEFEELYKKTSDSLEESLLFREKYWIQTEMRWVTLPTLIFVFNHEEAASSQFSNLLMREYYKWRSKLIKDWYMMAPYAHRAKWSWTTMKENKMESDKNYFELTEWSNATTLIKRINMTDAFFMKTPEQIKSFLDRFPKLVKMKAHWMDIHYNQFYSKMLKEQSQQIQKFIDDININTRSSTIDAMLWENFLIKLEDRDYMDFINAYKNWISGPKVKEVQSMLRGLTNPDLIEYGDYAKELMI